MLLVIDDEHKEHLSFLTDVSLDVVREFCRISIEFIRSGANAKVYQTAGQKLDVDATTVQHGVEGLMYLITESSKLMLNEVDFHDSIMTLGFSDDLRELLLQLYQLHRNEVRHRLGELAMDLPHYHNLEWRLDVQLASRSLRHQVSPTVLLRLHTRDGDQPQVHLLQTDPVNLLHLTQTLEEALQELKTPHCRRIVRNI